MVNILWKILTNIWFWENQEWKLNKDILTWIDVIDEQHYYFFLISNKVSNIDINSLSLEKMLQIIKDLEVYLDKHFECEELIMHKYLQDEPITDKQEHEHTHFLEKCTKSIRNIKNGNWDFRKEGETLFKEVIDWFYYHILQCDIPLWKILIEKGYKKEHFEIPEEYKDIYKNISF